MAWYVTIKNQLRGSQNRERHPRETKFFATEAEAKVFARTKLDEGLVLFAGTINPHVPRQVIPATKLVAWLDESPA